MPELKITKTTTTTSELAVMVERHAHGPLPTFTAPDPDELPLIAEAALAAMPDEQREEVLIKYGRLAHVSTHTLDGLGKENARLRAEVERLTRERDAAGFCQFYGAPTLEKEVSTLRENLHRAESDLVAATRERDDARRLVAEAEPLRVRVAHQRRELSGLHNRIDELKSHLDVKSRQVCNEQSRAEKAEDLVRRMRPVVEAAERARDRRDPCLDNYAGMTQHDLNLWRAVDEYRSRK